jgi:hypothetical protein
VTATEQHATPPPGLDSPGHTTRRDAVPLPTQWNGRREGDEVIELARSRNRSQTAVPKRAYTVDFRDGPTVDAKPEPTGGTAVSACAVPATPPTAGSDQLPGSSAS